MYSFVRGKFVQVQLLTVFILWASPRERAKEMVKGVINYWQITVGVVCRQHITGAREREIAWILDNEHSNVQRPMSNIQLTSHSSRASALIRDLDFIYRSVSNRDNKQESQNSMYNFGMHCRGISMQNYCRFIESAIWIMCFDVPLNVQRGC